MSTQFFRTKKGLHLTPQTTEPTGLELGDLWMDAEGTLKRWDGTASQDVGSGGVGSVDIMFADTFDATNISEYTTTGTVAVTDNVLEVIQGKKSLKITHTGGASAERVIPVDIKFRNKNVTLSFDVESDALSGNLTLTVVDETNTVTLVNAESIQPQGSLDTSIKRSVSFIIPDDCEELKYKFNAVSESGKISIIDNVVIELTQTAKMSTTIEVPVVTEWQSYTPTTQGFGVITSNAAEWRRVADSIEIRGSFVSGTVAASKATLSLPNGYSVDSSKLEVAGNTDSQRGARVGEYIVNGNSIGAILTAPATSTSLVYFGFNVISNSSSLIPSNGNNVVANTTSVSYTLTIPAVGLTATETQEVSLAQAVLKQESDGNLQINGFLPTKATTNLAILTIGSGTIVRNIGDHIIWSPSATLGDTFTATKDGIYTFNFSGDLGTTAVDIGFSKNSTQLNSTFNTINSQDKLYGEYESGVNDVAMLSWTGYLNKDDIVRLHMQNTALSGNTTFYSAFSCSYQGSLKQVNVTENQKIEIPTSELRMEGASTRGTGSDSAIVRFDTIAKLRGDAFTVESTAALGTVITMKKAGIISISSQFLANSNGASTYISKNQAVRTTDPTTPEILARGYSSAITMVNMAYTGRVEVGDIIRAVSSVTPTVSLGNSLNLSFQEQEIAVSVTNVLPQFSESDSSIRVDTANGYGSPTGTRIRRFSNVRDNLGTAITYVPSDVNGDSFRINEDGIYHISFSDYTSGGAYIGITLNSSNLSTNVTTLMQAANNEVLSHTSVSTNNNQSCSWSGYLQKDDVIRAHTDSNASLDVDAAKFTISKVGKPNVTGVDVTPFAKIEYEVSDAYIATGGAQASTNNRILYFTSVEKNTNLGVGVIENSATLGWSFTATKKCKLSMSYTLGSNMAGGISRNASGADLTTALFSLSAAKIVTYMSVITGGNVSVSTEIELNVGDVIRPHTQQGSSTTIGTFQVVATELRDAYQVIGGGVENTYSARIANNGTATITSQSYPFIQSVVRNSAGNVTINLVPGFFTVAPNVVAVNASSSQAGADRTAQVYSVSTTSIGILTNLNTGSTDFDFNIMVQRQGSDYRTPSKAIGLPQQRIAVLKDVKANNVSGGSASTTYTARVVNTLQDPTGIVANAASFTGTGGTNSSIVLNAGTYRLVAKAPCLGTSDAGTNLGGRSRIRLFNVTDASTIAIGQLTHPAGGQSGNIAGMDSADLEGYFTLTAQKTLEIQQRFATTTASSLGAAANFSEDEIYTVVSIEKIEE
jgi:hypothetical protein